jgi:hypothetical protein
LGTKRQIVFDIDRNIIDTIVGDMLFDLIDEFNNDEDADVEDLVFGSEADLNVVMHLRLEAVATAKLRVLALFKRIQYEADDNVNDKAQFSYSVTIPKTKTKLFNLVVRYVSCKVSFRGDLCLRVCFCQDVSKFIRVVNAINLQCIVDLL